MPPMASPPTSIASAIGGSSADAAASHTRPASIVYGCGNRSRSMSKTSRSLAWRTSDSRSLTCQGRSTQGPQSISMFRGSAVLNLPNPTNLSSNPLEQLYLPCVIQIVRRDPCDEIGNRVAALAAPGEIPGREIGDGLTQLRVHAIETRDVLAPHARLGAVPRKPIRSRQL